MITIGDAIAAKHTVPVTLPDVPTVGVIVAVFVRKKGKTWRGWTTLADETVYRVRWIGGTESEHAPEELEFLKR